MRGLARALVVGAAAWVTAIVWAPVGSRSAEPLARLADAATYTAGSFVCHQQVARSFAIDGRPLAVCGRCTGLYLSALAGGLFAFIPGVLKRRRNDRLWLAVAAAPTAASWLAEQAGLAAQSNLLRAVAALPLGFTAALVVVSLLMEAERAPVAG